MVVEYAESHVAAATAILSCTGKHFESLLAFEKEANHEFGGSKIFRAIEPQSAEEHITTVIQILRAEKHFHIQHLIREWRGS
jgi:hypothetical protein